VCLGFEVQDYAVRQNRQAGVTGRAVHGDSSKLRSPLHQGGFQLFNALFQGTSPVVAAVQQLFLGGRSLVSH